MRGSFRPHFGTVLILLQLTPISGAGVCVYHAAIGAKSCEMPVQTAPQVHDQAPSTPAHDCALMRMCTPGAPAVLQTVVQSFRVASPNHDSFVAPAGLFEGDRSAPPLPPPII